MLTRSKKRLRECAGLIADSTKPAKKAKRSDNNIQINENGLLLYDKECKQIYWKSNFIHSYTYIQCYYIWYIWYIPFFIFVGKIYLTSSNYKADGIETVCGIQAKINVNVKKSTTATPEIFKAKKLKVCVDRLSRKQIQSTTEPRKTDADSSTVKKILPVRNLSIFVLHLKQCIISKLYLVIDFTQFNLFAIF